MPKVSMDLDDLQTLAELAKLGGRQDNFITLILEWAESASNEIDKLRQEVIDAKLPTSN